MQQINTQSVDKKRKNIYAGLEENGRSVKKQKLAIPDASSFKCLDIVEQKIPSTDIIEIKYADIKHEGNSEAAESILHQIQQFKLAEELRQTPDPKLYDLLKQLLAARNMVKRDLAAALRYPFQKVAHYAPGTKRASGWNEFELKLLRWMQHSINSVKEEALYATKNEISLSNPDEEQIEDSAVDEEPMPSYEAYGTFEPDNYDEDDDWTNTNEDLKVRLPDSNLTRFSTPKYMLGSDEPTADLRLDPLPTFTRTLPQHNIGLQLDFTYLPYLRPPKPSETTSTNEDQAGRFIYEKMLEAWQGNNEFESQEKVLSSNKPKPFKSPNQNCDKPRYSARKAAFIVLKNAEKPLSIKQIAQISIEQGYQNPNMTYNTMAAAISYEIKKKDDSWFVRLGEGLYSINPIFR